MFSPACEDGYPCRLYDKLTGEINASVAAYWRENFDLAYIVERDWETLGPKLAGKAHVYVGGSDSFYLTNAVMDAADVFARVGSGARASRAAPAPSASLGGTACRTSTSLSSL